MCSLNIIFASSIMNALDYYILIPIAIGFVLGLFKGFIKEAISLVAIFVGIHLSKIFSSVVAQWLSNYSGLSLKTAQPIAFIIVFVVVAIALILVARILHKVAKGLSLGFINSIFGAIFGAIKITLVVSVVLILVEALNDKFNFISKELQENSTFYKPVKGFAPDLWKNITEDKK